MEEYVSEVKEDNSNTSHVIIYLWIRLRKPPQRQNSNTSHVIIYPSKECTNKGVNIIQIHLMLLFIDQNITVRMYKTNIQIHLMLLFIPVTGSAEKGLVLFKYISCYYLSTKKYISL